MSGRHYNLGRRSMMSIALGIPHAPWIPERAASLVRLLDALGVERGVANGQEHYKLFDDRESNRVWPTKLWTWAVETGATHLLQLQDDVIPGPNFWPALRAMLAAAPNQIIGLESAHPLGPEMQRTGRKWYRTRSWLIGVQYVFPTSMLAEFLRWCAAHPDRVASTNEDSLVSQWALEVGNDIWHPVPAIADHDLGVPSTYGNDGHHEWSMYRKPSVTWRDVPSLAALEDVNYWRCTAEGAPLLPGPGTQKCWMCNLEEGPITSATTGARIGKNCLAQMVAAAIGRM